ncbi:hypothetical protein HIM_00538 [Hirsutella minnesotensis 3608]|nr:hypothetical protein HIM_00538 [Hirsutella minnesotensis 3608]
MSNQHKPSDLPVLPPIPVVSDAGSISKDPAPAKSGGHDEIPQEIPGRSSNASYQAHGNHHLPRHRFLTPSERTIVAKAVGGVRDPEDQRTIHPTSWWWPPSGMPRGLYRDIVTCKSKFYFIFHTISIVRWSLMVSQLLIGAALTSLGSMSMKDGTPITTLGAVNTIIAGLLALLHNSGLPDRYRYDMAQFEELEDQIKELLDSGIAPADQTTDQILAECFDSFREAKATVTANMPVNYNSRKTLQAGNAEQVVLLPSAPQVSAPQIALTGTAAKARAVSEASRHQAGGSQHDPIEGKEK